MIFVRFEFNVTKQKHLIQDSKKMPQSNKLKFSDWYHFIPDWKEMLSSDHSLKVFMNVSSSTKEPVSKLSSALISKLVDLSS